MDPISEVKFSDFQNDERYRKLERELKLANLRKAVTSNKSWGLSMSPSLSSINVDASDINCNVPDPCAFRVGSEIVSSSNNLRNIVLRNDAKNNCRTMCTSSVRDCNSTIGLQEDYFMMPPPNFNFIAGASKKANSTPLPNVPRSGPAFQSKCTNKQSPKKTNSSSPQISPNNATQHAKNRIRIFTRWKVLLDKQDQLVIQGTINGGQFARSKPIARMLTPIKILSLFNHVYQLEGNIVDDECELPDYVRNKFYNGFPDDWENVHQIWQMYKQQGSKLTFRWPTPIADSDDDLRSEVTDLTIASAESMNISLANSLTYVQTNTNKENLSMRSLNVSEDNQQNRNKELIPYGDNKTQKVKDKLHFIVNSIADKNCSQEYLSKVIGIFDCLNYVLTHGSSRENESNTEITTLEEDKSVVQEQRKHVINDKSTSSNNGIDFNKSKCKSINIHPDKSTASNDCSLKLKNSAKANNCINENSSDSESEVYTGIPKISAERILRQREVLMKTYKHKTRSTNRLQRQCGHSEKKQTSSINTDNINHTYYNDSSVSIIGEHTEFSDVDKLTNSGIENNVKKYVNLGKTIRSQWKETNVSTKGRNPREMKEHFVQENPTTLHKLTENCSDFSDVNEDDTRKINETLENENAISKTNLRKKTSDKQSYNIPDNNYQTSSNTSKPVVVSSVAVDINKMYKEIAQTRNIDGNSRGSEKGVQHLSNEKSPVKTPNALKNIDPDSIDCDQKEHERSRKLIQLDRTRICGDKQVNGDIKTEKLSSWFPILICDPELRLCFEGKLLNSAGFTINRRFRTDAVLRRVSLNLIETISHKFYELVGDFNKHKHAVPKQLLNQCRQGCPANINMFCKKWKSLQSSNATENELNTTNIRVSSKGRRIMPPLSYWTGERFSTIQDNSVYSPGSHQNSSIQYTNKTSTNSKHMKETKQQQNNSNKENGSKESKSPNTYLTENKTNKSIVGGTEKVEGAKTEVVRRKKKRLVPRLSNSSNTSDGKSSPVKKRQRFTVNLQDSYTNDDEDESPRKLRKHSLKDEETKRKTRSNDKPVLTTGHVKKIVLVQVDESILIFNWKSLQRKLRVLPKISVERR
ncbi:uncharacterized protein LOC143356296 isoform X2 [Halictus rubicundus]|uniref:uncharacterized protein LOC143356296 isoform X2 n=1 Tax=Halictus rubicundus TaxID=77578 RepID=UPI0040351922